jgi:hypothetical protein
LSPARKGSIDRSAGHPVQVALPGFEVGVLRLALQLGAAGVLCGVAGRGESVLKPVGGATEIVRRIEVVLEAGGLDLRQRRQPRRLREHQRLSNSPTARSLAADAASLFSKLSAALVSPSAVERWRVLPAAKAFRVAARYRLDRPALDCQGDAAGFSGGVTADNSTALPSDWAASTRNPAGSAFSEVTVSMPGF